MLFREPRIGDVLFTKYYLKSSGADAMSSAVFNDLKKFNKDKPRIINPHPLFDNFGACYKAGGLSISRY